MLVPLDYYRILGLPIQATAEQLQQAHGDRTLQLPRREYSEVAIDARKQLLDEAYTVLCDPRDRKTYDAEFLAKTYVGAGSPRPEPAGVEGGARFEGPPHAHLDPNTPSIEIQTEQFVGALLILQELGEYELVLKLGLPYLSNNNISLKSGRFGEPPLVLPDILLTVALACLELGREQWQQNQYENAAASLETGQELLLREGLFPNVRGEMQADLYKLRPYRILELLALPETKATQRRRGLQLLREVLQERGGIDGTGDDQSGLSIDDFLRFIQQLRSYLTAAEQQELFEAEARRPSPVATYLAVYALVARGFAQRQPALIRRAKLMLTHLGRRQDVHLEQAVCALLLGQTEEASQALELTQEYEPLAFIREHSHSEPDMLPGLCLYGERWLQSEVFPHFRDLSKHEASLKVYFADEQVQAYLEALPAEGENGNEWVVVPPVREQIAVGLPQSAIAPEPVLLPSSRTSTATLSSVGAGVSTQPRLVRAASEPEQPAPRPEPQSDQSSNGSRPSPSVVSRPPRVGAGGARQEERTRVQVASRVRPTVGEDVPPRRTGIGQRGLKKFKSLKIERLILLGAGGVVGLLILWLLWALALGLIKAMGEAFSGESVKGEQLRMRLDQPLVPIPNPTIEADITNPDSLSEAGAVQVIQQWLTTKVQALGQQHAVDQLKQILVDPALAKWQLRAEAAKRDNWYWQYKHNVDVAAVQIKENDANQATVEAEVSEQAELFEGGQMTQSRNDKLLVRYELVRSDGQWRIRDWDILR